MKHIGHSHERQHIRYFGGIEQIMPFMEMTFALNLATDLMELLIVVMTKFSIADESFKNFAHTNCRLMRMTEIRPIGHVR